MGKTEVVCGCAAMLKRVWESLASALYVVKTVATEAVRERVRWLGWPRGFGTAGRGAGGAMAARERLRLTGVSEAC